MAGRSNMLATLLVLFAALVGCDRTPRAPLLRDESVYHNRREGFRFMAPEGWRMVAKSDIPSDQFEKERMLVEYTRSGHIPATLQLSAVNLEPTAALGEYLVANNFHKREYRTLDVEKDVKIGGTTTDRFSFPNSGQGLAKEVTPIRKGNRVFLFTGYFLKEDVQARDSIRRAIDSLVWEK